MNFTLFVLIIVYFGIISNIVKIINSYINKRSFSWDYGIATTFMIGFAVFFTHLYIEQTEFQQNLDATFDYFNDCTAAVKVNNQSPPPFIVEACGKEYEVYTEQGMVHKVKEIQ